MQYDLHGKVGRRAFTSCSSLILSPVSFGEYKLFLLLIYVTWQRLSWKALSINLPLIVSLGDLEIQALKWWKQHPWLGPSIAIMRFAWKRGGWKGGASWDSYIFPPPPWVTKAIPLRWDVHKWFQIFCPLPVHKFTQYKRQNKLFLRFG